MIRDDDRTDDSVRLARRAATSPYRVPTPIRLAPPRRGNGPRLLLAGGVLVTAAAGFAAYRTLGGGDGEGATNAPGAGGASSEATARIMAPAEITPSTPGYVSTLRGLVNDTVSLTANESPITIEPGGQFRVHLPQGATTVDLQATGSDGTVTSKTVAVTPTPTAAPYPETVAVHVRALDWANPAIRQQVIDMAASGRINAVELDVKDEAGEVGYDSSVALADQVGADREQYYDAEEALDTLHDLGVRVIGRIVCFLDPLVAGWAWAEGRSELVVLNGNGTQPLANNYGAAAFTNFANPEIRQYQIDLATEAAELGFDEILYDYVRRPEGDLDQLTFPGLDVPAEVSVARFVAETHQRLEGTETALGVSVFGISASRPLPTAQDIGLLAPNVEYVSPMVYPSHWGAGEYGVANPNAQPADIVRASLADFERLIAGSGAAMVPWLQDFSSGGLEYGPNEVRAQIQAAYEVGGDGFLLWNAGSTYHAGALDPRFGPAAATTTTVVAG